MKRAMAALALFVAALWWMRPADEPRRLELFVGSASQPPVEEIVRLFEARTGARVDLHVGSSGAMLSQLKLTRRGDVFFPGSPDYMEMAAGLVDPATEVRVADLVPAINVPAGNPKGIRALEDLARPGVRTAIARPDTVCVGLYAQNVLDDAGVRPEIVTHAESCAKLAQLVATGQVDAAVGWDVFAHWDPSRIQSVPIDTPRKAYLAAAMTRFAREPELAREFLALLDSEEGRAVFRKWGYTTR